MQRQFAGGEIGPTLYGGADQARYQSALSTCRNFLVMRHGGVAMRSGSQYVATVKNSAAQTYLVKFVYNDTDTYIIEAGNLYFRFHQKGAPVVIASPSAWSNVTAYVPGQFVLQGGVAYICIAANTNQQPPNATYWYALTASGSNWIVELPTPWLTADLSLLKYVQAGNIVTFTHPNYAPQQLKRSSGNWSLSAFSTAPWASPPTGVAATAGPTPVQTITFASTPTSGNLNLKYSGTALSITSAQGAVDLQTALQAVTGLGSVTVQGSYANGFTITMTGVTNPVLLTNNSSTLQTSGVNVAISFAWSLSPLTCKYVVTAQNTTTYEETAASSAGSCVSGGAPTATSPNVVTWNAVTGAAGYNVYLDPDGNGLYGFVGFTPNTTFNDTGFVPDASVAPPISVTLFNSSGNYPGCTTYYQQRQLFGGSSNNPEQVNASRTGFFTNFGISNPIQDDDAVQFGIAGRQINEVRHMIEVAGGLVVLTRTGEWNIHGDSDGVLRPTAINPHQHSYFGAANILPVIIGSAILYVQARQTLLRSLTKQDISSETGYTFQGQDLTLFAPHLFEHWTINRMDYGQIPDSIVWCVRSDGTLLGLTYVPELNTWGWHRHDSPNGIYEDVCAIAETMPRVAGSGYLPTSEDGVYVIVNRTIQGTTARYIERFASRNWFDYRLDAIYMDCDLDYNGINPASSSTTMTLSTGAGWTTSDLITVTASASTFDASWVGLGVTIWDTANPANVNRIVITQFVDSTHVKGNPVYNVQATLQNTAQTNWSKAVANVSGLSPLAAQAVTILANGIVYTGTVAANGTLTNVDGAGGLYDVIHVGLAPTFEIETLDLDSDQQPNIRGVEKLIHSWDMLILNSRLGFQAGPDASHLLPYGATAGTVLSTDVFSTGQALLLTQVIDGNVTATWAKAGRIHIRQTNPLPLAILGLVPSGSFGG